MKMTSKTKRYMGVNSLKRSLKSTNYMTYNYIEDLQKSIYEQSSLFDRNYNFFFRQLQDSNTDVPKIREQMAKVSNLLSEVYDVLDVLKIDFKRAEDRGELGYDYLPE